MPSVDFNIQQKLKKKSKKGVTGVIVQKYIEQNYANTVVIFTDGSKEPETGHTGAAVFIPEYKVAIKERATDHASVYTVELLAITLALRWLGGNNRAKALIASDSWAALNSIKTLKSCRQDMIMEIHQMLYSLHNKGRVVCFLWVPAHAGVEGNEDADILAKQALRLQIVNNNIPLGKAEGKTIIKMQMQKVWQEYWDTNETGRHFYNIQKQVGRGGVVGRSRKEEVVITRLRLGHTELNSTLHKIGKHPTGKCRMCDHPESVKHVLMECKGYERERRELKTALQREKVSFSIENILQRSESIRRCVNKYLRETGLMDKI